MALRGIHFTVTNLTPKTKIIVRKPRLKDPLDRKIRIAEQIKERIQKQFGPQIHTGRIDFKKKTVSLE